MIRESFATKFGLRPVAFGRKGMVATANTLATQAGLRMLARGGNAVDAIVASAAALGVVEPFMSGLGGCGVLLLSEKARPPRVLNFFGRAPEAATPEKLASVARETGVLSVAVPGNLVGWSRVLDDYGTVSLAEALEPAIELAQGGTPLTVFDRQMFDEFHATLDEEGGRIYLERGKPPAVGALVVQRELAATLRTIARDGVGAFYQGEIAAAICRDLVSRGGMITRGDLEAYPQSVRWSEPLVTTYRGVQVFAPPPPSSAVQILQTLNCIEAWSLGDLPYLGHEHVTVIAEASRAARLDTDRFVGDPEFVSVPLDALLSSEHTAELVRQVRARMDDAGTSLRHDRLGAPKSTHLASTTHLAACDAGGLAVNMTQSLGRGFGSGVTVRGTGVLLNNALNWTTSAADHPNVVRPGKRHEWPTAPLQVFKDGEFWATVGSPGSYGILVTSVQVLANLVDFGLNVQDAVSAPRIRWSDEPPAPLPAEVLEVESRIPESTLLALRERGYQLDVLGPWSMRVGGAQAIVRDPRTGWLAGGADPRRNGYAMGWS